MQSVRTAVEMCTGANGIAQSGKIPGDLICDYNKDGTPDGSERYPKLPKKCGSGPYFCVAPTSGNGWHVSTGTSAGCATSWDCKGCRLDCSTTGCQEIGSCK